MLFIYGFFADFCVCTNLIWIGRKKIVENWKFKIESAYKAKLNQTLTANVESNFKHPAHMHPQNKKRNQSKNLLFFHTNAP